MATALPSLASLRLPAPRSSTLRQPIPLFSAPAPYPVQPIKHVASPSLPFEELRKLAQLEVRVRVGPLFSGERSLVGESTGMTAAGPRVILHLLSDGAVIAEPEGGSAELVEQTRLLLEGNNLLISPSTRLILSAEALSAPSFAHWASAHLPVTSTPSIQISSKYLTPTWTPDSSLSTCESCTETKFGTFSRRHHCRSCGKGICRGCSRFKEGGERVCRNCYGRD